MRPHTAKLPFFSDMLAPLLLIFLILFVIGVLWLIRRQRRLVRADLEKRGLVPGRRRRRRHRKDEKRNPTLAQSGGLPPLRAEAAVRVPGIEHNAK